MKRLPVEVTGISGCVPYQGYVVILREQSGQRMLPIFIGVYEAHNINLLLQGVKPARPLTYDFCHQLINAASTKIQNVTVTQLREHTFFAEVELELKDGSICFIDARPSDAIAMAVRTESPIFVAENVMNEASFTGGDVPVEMVEQGEIEQKLSSLYKELTSAVENEAFEDAAKLRDKIKELEEEKNKIA